MIPEIIARCASLHGISVAQLRSASRRRACTQARQAAAWCMHAAYPTLTLIEIAAAVGWKDHSTVVYALSAVADRIAQDGALGLALQAIATAAARHVPIRPVSAPPPAPRAADARRAMRYWAAQGRRDWAVVAA